MSHGTLQTNSAPAAAPPRRRATGGRTAVVVLLIVALVAAGLTRELARGARTRSLKPDQLARDSASSLSGMNSFALGLLLGGLRGPLVMILWTQSENQKNERNLEDFDTLVEWIRMLQPEFVSVHLFQIWNKAYNISVQMASLANKYATIIDALDYAETVDQQRPNDISIVSQIGQLYEQKLGGSTEKHYYRERVRNETLPVMRVRFAAASADEFAAALKKAQVNENQVRRTTDAASGQVVAQMRFLDATAIRPLFGGAGVTYEAVDSRTLRPKGGQARRTTLDTLLDADGRILAPYRARLNYLVPFEPFPEGLSPMALSYQYYQEALRMQTEGQTHPQVSEMVVDMRPALTLKMWAEENLERGRVSEMRAMGQVPPTGLLEPQMLQMPTAGVAPGTAPANAAALESAIVNYDRIPDLVKASIAEYERHLKSFSTNLMTYRGHMEHLRAIGALAAGDAAYLEAMRGESDRRGKWLQAAAENYRLAVQHNQSVILRHYYEDDLLAAAIPRGYTIEDLKGGGTKTVPPAFYPLIIEQVKAVQEDLRRRNVPVMDQLAEDRSEYEQYLARAQTRLGLIDKAAPASQPGQ